MLGENIPKQEVLLPSLDAQQTSRSLLMKGWTSVSVSGESLSRRLGGEVSKGKHLLGNNFTTSSI